MDRRGFLGRLVGAMGVVALVPKPAVAEPKFPPDNWIDLPVPIKSIDMVRDDRIYLLTCDGIYACDGARGPFRIDATRSNRFWFTSPDVLSHDADGQMIYVRHVIR